MIVFLGFLRVKHRVKKGDFYTKRPSRGLTGERTFWLLIWTEDRGEEEYISGMRRYSEKSD